MEGYRTFLIFTAKLLLTVCLIATAIAGILAYPLVTFFSETLWVTSQITALSVMLSGFCLARLLAGLAEKTLTRSYGFLLLLGTILSLLVLPIRSHFPFVFQDYVFPLLTGLIVPRLLLASLPSSPSPTRWNRIGTGVTGSILLGVCLITIYGAAFAPELVRLLICRLVPLPLLWFTPLFSFYARRCGYTGKRTAIASWLLPLLPMFSILWPSAFGWFPILFCLFIVTIGIDRLFSSYSSGKIPSIFRPPTHDGHNHGVS